MKQGQPNPIHLVVGLTIWAAWFVLVYAGQAIACELKVPATDSVFTWINLALLASGVTVAAILLMLARAYQRAALLAHRAALRLSRFIHGAAAAASFVAALSTIFISIPMVMLPSCV